VANNDNKIIYLEGRSPSKPPYEEKDSWRACGPSHHALEVRGQRPRQ
jgi:hypothetical protein